MLAKPSTSLRRESDRSAQLRWCRETDAPEFAVRALQVSCEDLRVAGGFGKLQRRSARATQMLWRDTHVVAQEKSPRRLWSPAGRRLNGKEHRREFLKVLDAERGVQESLVDGSLQVKE